MVFFSYSSTNIIKSLGLVFGDIGTSPIYTIGAILLFILPTASNILGLLSLIVWGYALVSFLINDQIKVWLFRTIHPYS